MPQCRGCYATVPWTCHEITRTSSGVDLTCSCTLYCCQNISNTVSEEQMIYIYVILISMKTYFVGSHRLVDAIFIFQSIISKRDRDT